ncbi:MAG: ribbon-helix-helix protein, CopG family [Acidobacteriota bacterium]
MKKALQVYVDQADLERLEQWARVRGWTKSQAVRVALRALVSTDEDDPLIR